MRAVSRYHGAGTESFVEDDSLRDADVSHPVLNQMRACGHRMIDQAGVEDLPGDDPHRSRHSAVNRMRSSRQTQLLQWRPALDHIGRSQRAQDV